MKTHSRITKRFLQSVLAISAFITAAAHAGPVTTDDITRAFELNTRNGHDIFFFKKIWDIDVPARQWWSLSDGYFYEYDNGTDSGAIFTATFNRGGYTMKADFEYDTKVGNRGWTGGTGAFSLFDDAGTLLETHDWVGKADGSGREAVLYRQGPYKRLSGWFSDDLTHAATHLGDYHVRVTRIDPSHIPIAVSEPAIFLLFGLGTLGLALRQKKLA